MRQPAVDLKQTDWYLLLSWCWSTLLRLRDAELCSLQEFINPYRGTIERRSKMKTPMLIGIILIVIGIIALAYQGITYTTREKVVDIGPIQMSADKTKTIPLPPILGGIALVGGIVLVVAGSKKG
jgi:hypothetical protein